MKNHESQPTETTLFPETNVVNLIMDKVVVVVMIEVETVDEEETIIIYVVVILIIQISKGPHGTMIMKEKLHKTRIQKVMKKYAIDHVV